MPSTDPPAASKTILSPPSEPESEVRTLPGQAWSRGSRAVAGAFVLATAVGVVLLVVAILFATDPPVTPRIVRELFVLQVVLPAAVVAALRRHTRARLVIEADRLVVLTRVRRIEIPRESITDFEPWWLPLPGPGVTLRLRSGRRLSWALEARDPAAFLDAVGGSSRSRDHPSVRWADARVHRRRTGHRALLAKYPGLAVPFALLFFYTHQHIAYGGFFGQWNLLGWQAWLTTLLEYWTTVLLYFLLWGGCLRGLAEVLAWIGATLGPAHALAGRRLAERLASAGYLGGILALTALRYLA